MSEVITTHSQRTGESLASWMQTKELTSLEALHLVRQVADELAAAHATGLIHEDLRPETIFVTEEKVPILFDPEFSAEDLPETAVAPEDTPEILDYPAPEVLKGNPPSNQSNIYSLGVILYELLAQAKPRLPVSTWDIFERRSVPQPIPLEQTRPGLASATYQVVKTCLWWQKWNRYQTMAELVEALNAAIVEEEALLAPPSVKPKRMRRRPRFRPIYAGAAALMLLVLLAGGWLLRNRGGGGVAEGETGVANIIPSSTEPTLVADEVEEQPDTALAAIPVPTDDTALGAAEPTASPTPLPSPTAMPTAVPTATAVPPTPTPTATPIPTPEGLVLIPAGTFMMGSAEGQVMEMPVHEVTLSAYFLDQFEVTNAQYRACVEAGACTQTSFPNSFTVPGYRDEPFYDAYPVVGVTWDQAFFYCNWAGKRLPTEVEWEYAARGSENLSWPWGNSFDASLSAASARDVQPVDSYPDGASPFGIYNMAGNVAEWVLDVFDASNFYANSPAENPVNLADGLDRVYRGGSFDNPDSSAYLTYRRLAQLRTFTDVDIGFRCAADVPAP